MFDLSSVSVFTVEKTGVPLNGVVTPYWDTRDISSILGSNLETVAGLKDVSVDAGLGGFLQAAGYGPEVYLPEWGKQKVPTLRNVDKRPYEGFVKAYAHNGFFKSLEEIVHFYNTRDVEPWPAPEVAETVNTEELGDLGLTSEEEAALVAFMKTLSDGWWVEP